jgi:hypothetical protein
MTGIFGALRIGVISPRITIISSRSNLISPFLVVLVFHVLLLIFVGWQLVTNMALVGGQNSAKLGRR